MQVRTLLRLQREKAQLALELQLGCPERGQWCLEKSLSGKLDPLSLDARRSLRASHLPDTVDLRWQIGGGSTMAMGLFDPARAAGVADCRNDVRATQFRSRFLPPNLRFQPAAETSKDHGAGFGGPTR